MNLFTQIFIGFFVVNALHNGWDVKQVTDNSYTFTKILKQNGVEYDSLFRDPLFYLEGFMKVNSNLQRFRQLTNDETLEFL